MDSEVEILNKRIEYLEQKLEIIFELLGVENELDFIMKGTYLTEDDIDEIMNGEY